MGTPTTTSWLGPPGTDCPACTPTPIPSGATPSVLQAVIHNVIACPGNPDPPIGQIATLYQNPADACHFVGSILHLTVTFTYSFRLNLSQFLVTIPPPFNFAVFSALGPPCSYPVFTNTLACPGNAGTGGTANILGPVPGVITDLAFTMNFQPDARGLFDLFDAAEPGHKIVRLTGRNSPGSCLFDYLPP